MGLTRSSEFYEQGLVRWRSEVGGRKRTWSIGMGASGREVDETGLREEGEEFAFVGVEFRFPGVRKVLLDIEDCAQCQCRGTGRERGTYWR